MHLPLNRLIILTITLLCLSACERETYTSWTCNSMTEMKVPMVLRKAQMEFKSLKLNYCGSLGNQSYFDQQCPGLTQASTYTFTPSTGVLIGQEQDYQCSAL